MITFLVLFSRSITIMYVQIMNQRCMENKIKTLHNSYPY
jgi:hypothetical protein